MIIQKEAQNVDFDISENAKRLLTFEKYSSEWDTKLTYGT